MQLVFIRYKFRKESAKPPSSGVRRDGSEAYDNYVTLDTATTGHQLPYAVLQLNDQRHSDGVRYANIR